MIRRPFAMTAVGLTLALAACNGGDPDPTPTPTPTGSPTPTPTASPSYAAFPLTTATEFVTITASTSYTGNLATGPVTLGAAGTEARSDRVRLAVGTDTATGTWVFREAAEESRYQTAAVQTAPDAAVTEYVFRTNDTTTAGKFSQAEFLNNTYPAKVTSNPAYNLTRVSYANWLRADSTSGQTRFTSTVWGYPTVNTDLPKTGTSTYSARVNGRMVQATAGGAGTLERVGGTVTITVNWATGLVDTTVNLTRLGAGGAETPFGTFSGSGAIAVGAIQFNGAFGGASPFPGTFQGGFFGSAGEQIGVTFAGLGVAGGLDTRIAGTIVGRKN